MVNAAHFATSFQGPSYLFCWEQVLISLDSPVIKYLTTVNAVLQRVRSVAHNMHKTSQSTFYINTVSSGSKSLSICIVSDWTLETRKTLKTYGARYVLVCLI